MLKLFQQMNKLYILGRVTNLYRFSPNRPSFKTKSSVSRSYPAFVCAKSLQSCLTLYDPMDCNLSDSSVPGTLQERILEWDAMPSSRVSSRLRDPTLVS